MNAQNLPDGKVEDKDITDVIILVRRTFNWLLSQIFKGIEYCLKYWWVLLILIVTGIALSYLNDNSKTYNSSLIVQTNFGGQPYVYNAIDQINENLQEGDREFLTGSGINVQDFNITSLEIEPIVDIVNIMAKIQLSDRSLNTIFGELNQKGDKELFSTDLFNQNYKYHKLELTFSSNESKNSIEAILSFINNQPFAQELKAESLVNLNERIMENDRTLKQINEVIDVYAKSLTFTSTNSDKLAFYNNQSDLSMQEVFEFKTELGQQTEYLKNGRVGQSDLVVVVSSTEIALDNSLFKKTIFTYPFLLVFLFLFIVFVRYTYTSLKSRVENYSS
jgi:hypothetical protein